MQVIHSRRSPTLYSPQNAVFRVFRHSAVECACSNMNFFFFVVDRGILMTFGSGMHGSLGHGNYNDVVQAKIVEALIGNEVEQVREEK